MHGSPRASQLITQCRGFVATSGRGLGGTELDTAEFVDDYRPDRTTGHQTRAPAQDAGVVRRDLAPTDVPPLLLMITIGADIAGPTQPDHWRRYHQILLDGIRPHPAQRQLAAPPLTDDELDQALLQWDLPR